MRDGCADKSSPAKNEHAHVNASSGRHVERRPHSSHFARATRSLRILRRNAVDTDSSQSDGTYESFFSILFRLLRLALAPLLMRPGCANIFASDLLRLQGSSLETFQINKARSHPAA